MIILKGIKRFIKKHTVLAILMLVLFTSATGTFAYWASSVLGDDSENTAIVDVGEGDAVTTTVTVSNQTDSGPLVPVGHTGTNDVDLTFPVLWTSDNDASADALTGTLAVTIDSVLINGVDYSHLFTVTVISGTGAITEDASQDVVVNVEFTNEPADQTEYDLVATEDVVVTLTFTVTPN